MKHNTANAYAFFVLCFLFLFCAGGCEDRQPSSYDPERQDTAESSAADGKRVIHLYFADRDNTYLTAEDKRISRPEDTTHLGSIIVNALIAGPQKTLMRTLPQGTALRAFYTAEDGLAYVDLSEEVRENHPGGARSELLTIYSVVNSLVLNIEEIEVVKILVEGREVTTLAGHIDLRFPINANMLLIR